MIDAATIGITLALNNGVSEGIALIRRELAGLDAAVAASGVNLSQLVALAESSGVTVATRAAAALLPVLPRPAAAAQAGAPDADPTAALTRPHAAPFGPALAVPRVLAAEPFAITPGPVRAPIPAQLDASLSLAPVPPAAEVPDYAAFGRALAATPMQPARYPTMGTERDGPPGSELAHAMPMAPIGPVTLSRIEENDEPAPAMRTPAAPIPNSRVASATPTPMAPPPARQPGAPAVAEQMINGDLHLDGYMIGRFISEYLAEAATRPLAGATAFDPRISPAWSGPAGAA